MGRAHFCCCLPVRLGALLISFGQVACSLAVAAGLWYVLLEKPEYFGGSQPLKIAAIVMAVIQSINTLVSFFAFWGTVANKLSLLTPFIRIYTWELGVNVVFSVLYVVLIFTRSRESIAKSCTAGSTNQDVIDACESQANVNKTATVVSLVVSLLFQAYFLWIVSQYADQLREKESRSRAMDMNAPAFKYTPVGRQSEDAFTAPPVHYPYADGKNAFGHSHV